MQKIWFEYNTVRMRVIQKKLATSISAFQLFYKRQMLHFQTEPTIQFFKLD